MTYLRTPHMLEKTTRELRSTDRSSPAITASANGMTITGTNGPMHWSMMLRFKSCASISHLHYVGLLCIMSIYNYVCVIHAICFPVNLFIVSLKSFFLPLEHE